MPKLTQERMQVSFAGTLADMLLVALKGSRREMWLSRQAVRDLTRLAEESPRHDDT